MGSQNFVTYTIGTELDLFKNWSFCPYCGNRNVFSPGTEIFNILTSLNNYMVCVSGTF